MSSIEPKKRWLRLPKWGAVLLGFGAFFASDARADKSAVEPPGTAAGPANRGGIGIDEVLIRTEGDRILISRDGSTFNELSLGNSPEAAYFRKLLRDMGTANGDLSIPTGSIIVANGGSNVDGTKPRQPGKKKVSPKPTTGPGKPSESGKY
jgi:hypothetical protein